MTLIKRTLNLPPDVVERAEARMAERRLRNNFSLYVEHLLFEDAQKAEEAAKGEAKEKEAVA